MIFNLSNPYEVDKYKEYVNKLFKDRAVVEVKKRLPNRTLAQNSYLHLILSFLPVNLAAVSMRLSLTTSKRPVTVIYSNERKSISREMKSLICVVVQNLQLAR